VASPEGYVFVCMCWGNGVKAVDTVRHVGIMEFALVTGHFHMIFVVFYRVSSQNAAIAENAF